MEAAFDRISILKAIVGGERTRAESDPSGPRNIALGLIDVDRPRSQAKDDLKLIFNELELLLDHLSILHMAASFEFEAMAKLSTVVGAARKAIEASRRQGDRWPANLVRDAKSFEGLHDIEQVLGLNAEDQAAMRLIRAVRNRFSHGVPLDEVPSITAEQTRHTLVEALARIK